MTETEAQLRLEMLRSHVAKPIPQMENWTDPDPAWVEGSSILIGNKYHASDVEGLERRGVTAVLNCASGGISRLPMDELSEKGIAYHFTNVRQDNPSYPILFDHKTGEPSKHLQVAKSVYSQVLKEGGRVMFFCVAGQNRYVYRPQDRIDRQGYHGLILTGWLLQIGNVGGGCTDAFWAFYGRYT
jgi:hypothetical protein